MTFSGNCINTDCLAIFSIVQFLKNAAFYFNISKKGPAKACKYTRMILLDTLVFQLEEVGWINVVAYHFVCVMCWIKVVAHKIENVLGGI